MGDIFLNRQGTVTVIKETGIRIFLPLIPARIVHWEKVQKYTRLNIWTHQTNVLYLKQLGFLTDTPEDIGVNWKN